MATMLITGGTGLVGKALSKALLECGHHVIILSRTPKKSSHSYLSYASWDVEKMEIDKSAIAQADHIIHLAGASVAEKRWSDRRKKEIRDSRVESGNLLVKSLKEINNKVKTVISASAIGYYGPDPAIPNPHPFTEDDPPADNFLGEICREWEEAIQPVAYMDKRLVKLRIGIVLSNEEGMVKEFKKPLRFGIASILGNGKQMISWIHIDDLVNMFLFALDNEHIEGVFNAVGPKPVSNKEFVLALAKKLRGKFAVPVYVPSFVLQIMLGEMSYEVTKSATVSADKILQEGFSFKYSHIKPALRGI
jgi:uncharacterized protein